MIEEILIIQFSYQPLGVVGAGSPDIVMQTGDIYFMVSVL